MSVTAGILPDEWLAYQVLWMAKCYVQFQVKLYAGFEMEWCKW